MSTSACCSSACSTLICPAGRQTFPAVIFHSLTRPSFPADERIVLYDRQNARFTISKNEPHAPRYIPLHAPNRRLMIVKVAHHARRPPCARTHSRVPVCIRVLAVKVLARRRRADAPDTDMAVARGGGDEVVRAAAARCPRDARDRERLRRRAGLGGRVCGGGRGWGFG